MSRLGHPRLVTQLLVLLLVVVVQVATLSAFSAAGSDLDGTSGPSQLLEEEELDDVTVADELVSLDVGHASRRWECDPRAPAPVHLDREARPPSFMS